MTVKSRVEHLERKTEGVDARLIVIGEPTPEQKALIDSGQVRTVMYLPDNGRDRERTREQS